MDYQQLKKNHPDLFKSDPPCGAYFGPGWFDLIDKLCTDIKNHCTVHAADLPEIVQIKEKFGGLRVYTGPACEYVQCLIRTAEDSSYNLCEVCGNDGRLRQDRSWIKTLCDEHDIPAK